MSVGGESHSRELKRVETMRGGGTTEVCSNKNGGDGKGTGRGLVSLVAECLSHPQHWGEEGRADGERRQR